MDKTTLLVICIFPFAFAVIWIVVNFILSRFGWYDLAKYYRYDASFEGTNAGIISSNISGINYNNILNLRYNKEGFYLKTIFLFRLFHPPIFIPWKEIKNVKEGSFIFFRYKELSIGEPEVAKIRLKLVTFERMMAR